MLKKKIYEPGEELIYIPFLWRDIIQNVSKEIGRLVLFDWGHHHEVAARLQEKNGGMSDAERTKFPLVWLVCDFPEEKGYQSDVYAKCSTQLIIASLTDQNFTMEQRAEEIFLPVLYPIYSSILTQVSKERRIQVPTRDMISHTKVDRYYWMGGMDEKGQNLFTDPVEAIEIRNMEFIIKQPWCY